MTVKALRELQVTRKINHQGQTPNSLSKIRFPKLRKSCQNKANQKVSLGQSQLWEPSFLVRIFVVYIMIVFSVIMQLEGLMEVPNSHSRSGFPCHSSTANHSHKVHSKLLPPGWKPCQPSRRWRPTSPCYCNPPPKIPPRKSWLQYSRNSGVTYPAHNTNSHDQDHYKSWFSHQWIRRRRYFFSWGLPNPTYFCHTRDKAIWN